MFSKAHNLKQIGIFGGIALLATVALYFSGLFDVAIEKDIQSLVRSGQIAPRLQNLGQHTHAVTTSSPRAQLFFNQGMILAFGFNHREAKRSFEEAARLDPDLAMAYWGQAWVLGPNINVPMDPANEPIAEELVKKALSLSQKVTQRERDYIQALTKRYDTQSSDSRERKDRLFADAMREVSMQHPRDWDAATIYAEALMDLRPWNYWTRDHKPYPETRIIVRTLEEVLRQNPDHPGALHYYIHAVEASKNPERAEWAADRLDGLVPGAGHLRHMPSHIYMRVGRYEDAIAANRAASATDEDYIAQCRAQGIYPLAYYPHNVHFLSWAAMMDGQSEVSLTNAAKSAGGVPQELMGNLSLLNTFSVIPYFVMVRFEKWDDILAAEEPPEEHLYWRGVWHYARGCAFAAKEEFESARDELEKMADIARNEELRKLALFSSNLAGPVLDVGIHVLAGEIAKAEGNIDEALKELHRAVHLHDSLIYNEPPDWLVSSRHSLGAALLKANRPREAGAVFWHDLRLSPDNPWALFGLLQALNAQGETEEAQAITDRFHKAWSRADLDMSTLTWWN